MTFSDFTPVPRPTAPIGLFDSGIGGATVLQAVRMHLPGEDLLYLADQAHCPYGPRPPAEIRDLSFRAADWLLAQGVKLIVVACNTASAAALRSLRAAYPQVPFVGMVPPVKPASLQSRSRVVGVMATPATMQGELLQEVVDQWARDVTLIPQICHGLVEQVEQGALDTPETEALVRRYVEPFLARGADHVVLGCTHYPYLRETIRRILGPDVVLVEPTQAVARQVARVLAERGLLRPPRPGMGLVRYVTTGDPAHLAELIRRLHLPEGPVDGIGPLSG